MPLFQTVTPYRMDDEARALAKRSSLGTDEHPSRKRRKKLSAAACTGTVTDLEVDHVSKHYERFCQKLRGKFFPGSPTLEDVEANNRGLREHVSMRMTAVEEAQVLYGSVVEPYWFIAVPVPVPVPDPNLLSTVFQQNLAFSMLETALFPESWPLTFDFLTWVLHLCWILV
jgi:hypothetical protein